MKYTEVELVIVEDRYLREDVWYSSTRVTAAILLYSESDNQVIHWQTKSILYNFKVGAFSTSKHGLKTFSPWFEIA